MLKLDTDVEQLNVPNHEERFRAVCMAVSCGSAATPTPAPLGQMLPLQSCSAQQAASSCIALETVLQRHKKYTRAVLASLLCHRPLFVVRPLERTARRC